MEAVLGCRAFPIEEATNPRGKLFGSDSTAHVIFALGLGGQPVTILRSVSASDKLELLHDAHGRIANYAIAFTKLTRNSGVEDAVLAGSGTLVRVGSSHGILTADHVLANLPDHGEVGLVLHLRPETRVHRFVVDMEYAKKVHVAKASNDEYGPDLGVLLLSPATTSQLRATGSFCDLRAQQSRMLETPPPSEIGGWVLFGFIEEWCTAGSAESGFTRVKEFRSLCGGGGLSAQEERAQFDYLRFEVEYGSGYQGPQSFAGLSGGALWHVIPGVRDDKICMSEVLLSGVPFFEVEIRDGRRTIASHGRRSIYLHVVSAMEAV